MHTYIKINTKLIQNQMLIKLDVRATRYYSIKYYIKYDIHFGNYFFVIFSLTILNRSLKNIYLEIIRALFFIFFTS